MEKTEMGILWDRIEVGGLSILRGAEYISKLCRVLIADFESRKNTSLDISSHVVEYLIDVSEKNTSIPLTLVPKDGRIVVVDSPESADFLLASGWASSVDSCSTTIPSIAALTGNRTNYIDSPIANKDLCICATEKRCCEYGERIILDRAKDVETTQ
jgi:hypothetical protein